MRRIFVKPSRKGLIVRHPEKMQHVLPEQGEWVNRSTQWLRYISNGSVIEVAPPEVEAKPSKEIKASKAVKVKTLELREDQNQLNGGE